MASIVLSSLFNNLHHKIEQIMGVASKKRDYIFGIAIILVILYHTVPYQQHFPFLKLFAGGSVGVDILLFFSGYGLCFSIKAHSLKNFYKRRFIRVIPLFVLYAILITIYRTYADDVEFTPWDWFCNLSTLSYYRLGGCFVDWYLSALCLFYLLFPLFYKLTNVWTTVIVFIFIVLLYLVVGRPHWTFDVAIARIPIFMAGIMAYKNLGRLALVLTVFLLFFPICMLFRLGLSLSNVCYAFVLIGFILFPFVSGKADKIREASSNYLIYIYIKPFRLLENIHWNYT